jgi:hypothetical protein
MGSWADGAFAALPLVATAAHLYVLSTAAKPIWERSGEISIHHISQSIPGTLIKTLDAAFGYRHLRISEERDSRFTNSRTVVSLIPGQHGVVDFRLPG